MFPPVLASEQNAYVQDRYIVEGTRSISDILVIFDKLNIGGYLVAVDIRKTLDSLEHEFQKLVPESFGIGNNSIDWVKIY